MIQSILDIQNSIDPLLNDAEHIPIAFNYIENLVALLITPFQKHKTQVKLVSPIVNTHLSI